MKNKFAFTFVELLVVVAIISIIWVLSFWWFKWFLENYEDKMNLSKIYDFITEKNLEISNKKIFSYEMIFEKNKNYFTVFEGKNQDFLKYNWEKFIYENEEKKDLELFIYRNEKLEKSFKIFVDNENLKEKNKNLDCVKNSTKCDFYNINFEDLEKLNFSKKDDKIFYLWEKNNFYKIKYKNNQNENIFYLNFFDFNLKNISKTKEKIKNFEKIKLVNIFWNKNFFDSKKENIWNDIFLTFEKENWKELYLIIKK